MRLRRPVIFLMLVIALLALGPFVVLELTAQQVRRVLAAPMARHGLPLFTLSGAYPIWGGVVIQGVRLTPDGRNRIDRITLRGDLGDWLAGRPARVQIQGLALDLAWRDGALRTPWQEPEPADQTGWSVQHLELRGVDIALALPETAIRLRGDAAALATEDGGLQLTSALRLEHALMTLHVPARGSWSPGSGLQLDFHGGREPAWLAPVATTLGGSLRWHDAEATVDLKLAGFEVFGLARQLLPIPITHWQLDVQGGGDAKHWQTEWVLRDGTTPLLQLTVRRQSDQIALRTAPLDWRVPPVAALTQRWQIQPAGPLWLEATIGAGAAPDWRLVADGVTLVHPAVTLEEVAGAVLLRPDWPLVLHSAAPLRARRLIAGLPVTDVRAMLRWQDGVLELTDLTGALAGGQLRAAPLRWRPGVASLPIGLELVAADLPQLLTLLRVRDASGTGRVSGQARLLVRAAGILVEEATFTSVAGQVRYRGALPSGQAEMALLGAALDDFHYTRLRLTAAGELLRDLRTTLTLAGSNPTLYKGRALSLNINLDGAILPLLRQLAPAGSAEE